MCTIMASVIQPQLETCVNDARTETTVVEIGRCYVPTSTGDTDDINHKYTCELKSTIAELWLFMDKSFVRDLAPRIAKCDICGDDAWDIHSRVGDTIRLCPACVTQMDYLKPSIRSRLALLCEVVREVTIDVRPLLCRYIMATGIGYRA